MNDQQSLNDQIRTLRRLACQHGLYDADDWLRRHWGEAIAVSVVVPEDGDLAPDVGPDPVVLPRTAAGRQCQDCGGQGDLLGPCPGCDGSGVVRVDVGPRAAVCNNWERWTEDE